MQTQANASNRVFKTKLFARGSKKVRITEEELCAAMREVMLGQADDLGGGVFKKRLNKNLDRSIVLAQGGSYWVFEYFFSKKDRANIDRAELIGFRQLASIYERYTERDVAFLLANKEWQEICNDHP